MGAELGHHPSTADVDDSEVEVSGYVPDEQVFVVEHSHHAKKAEVVRPT
ncbi:MAG: hypothetical protein OXU74_10170 [Gemmatimonadota bacterium]|nr:hypothetical protein [Gemmatimonadota bacterium]